MGLFSDKKRDDRIRQVETSFAGLKANLSNFGQWIQYLTHKDQQQDFKLNELESELVRQGLSRDKIKSILQAKYQYHYLVEKIRDIEDVRKENEFLKMKIDELEKFKDEYFKIMQKLNEIDILKEYYSMMHAKMQDIDNRLEQKMQQIVVQKPSFKERIIRKFTQNSKEHTANFILNLIRKYEEISALQLREIVVEEQGICSKSSFYRALEDLEKGQEIAVEKQGKEKRYKAIHIVH